MNLLSVGLRPTIETHVPVTVAAVIIRAWAADPAERPSFQELLDVFRDPSREFHEAFAQVEGGLQKNAIDKEPLPANAVVSSSYARDRAVGMAEVSHPKTPQPRVWNTT